MARKNRVFTMPDDALDTPFKAKGKFFMARKIGKLPTLEPPPLRVCMVLTRDANVPMLQDDAFLLLKLGIISRTRHSNWFMRKETLTEQEQFKFSVFVSKARSAGAHKVRVPHSELSAM